jgi:hypothetical protein
MIKQFDRENLKALRTEINEALHAVAIKHKISIKAGNCSFQGPIATFKVELAVTSQDGEVVSREALYFKNNAVFVGLKAEDLGKEFPYAGRTFKVVGMKTRGENILAQDISNKKMYKLPAMVVVAQLMAKV